jgi:hypothetical protein
MERKTDKIENYLKKIVLDANGSIIEAKRSSYYNVNGHIIRVSDHIGANSSGNMSIVIPGFNCRKNDYIIHAHNTGEISIVDYERLKEICRSFVYMSSVFNSMVQTKFDFEVEAKEKFNAIQEQTNINKELDDLRKIKAKYEKLVKNVRSAKNVKADEVINNDVKDYILGVPVDVFSAGQLTCIRSTVMNVLKKRAAVQPK